MSSITASPSISGIDGRVRDWDAVFAPFASLGQDQRSGYVVRRTFFDRARPHEDVRVLHGADSYDRALQVVRDVRGEGHAGFAVIDGLYEVDGEQVRIAA